MTPATPAQRKAQERARKAAAGLVRVEMHAHPQDVPQLKRLAAELLLARDPKKPSTG